MDPLANAVLIFVELTAILLIASGFNSATVTTYRQFLMPVFLVSIGACVKFCIGSNLNVEFADIVETTPEFYHAIDHKESVDHMARWKEVNYFLYAENFWKSQAVDQFYQAELEINLDRYYRYN